MSRSERELHVEALEVLLTGRVVPVIRAGDFELLQKVVRLADDDAPTALAVTDPALFRAWREAVTSWYLKGWGSLRIAKHTAGEMVGGVAPDRSTAPSRSPAADSTPSSRD